MLVHFGKVSGSVRGAIGSAGSVRVQLGSGGSVEMQLGSEQRAGVLDSIASRRVKLTAVSEAMQRAEGCQITQLGG